MLQESRRRRIESEIQDGEVVIRDRRPNVSTASSFRLDGFLAYFLFLRSQTRGLGVTGERQLVETGDAIMASHARGLIDRIGGRLEWSDGLLLLDISPKGNYIWEPQNFEGPVRSGHLHWVKTGLVVV